MDLDQFINEIRKAVDDKKIDIKITDISEIDYDYIMELLNPNQESKIKIDKETSELGRKIEKILNTKHCRVGKYFCQAFDLLENNNEIDENKIDDPVLIEMIAFILILQKFYPEIKNLIPINKRSRMAFTLAFDGWMLRSIMADSNLIDHWQYD